MQDFRKLKVWQKSPELTLAIDKATVRFPKDEAYGLTGQMRRAGASIAANIAEGRGRDGNAEFARFLSIAMGSASELQYHLILARDLALLGAESAQLKNEVSEIKRILTSLIRRLKSEN